MGQNGAVPRLQRRSFDTPDTVREFPFGRADIVNLDETAIGRFVCEPGWRWSAHVAPTARTETCQLRHVGYAIDGNLHVLMDDGTELGIVKGDAYEIPPGHDAWVIGDDTWETVEFTSARVFGAAPDADDERLLATILFTDIVDSTAIAGRLGDKEWRRILLDHNDRMRGALDHYRGREVVTTGDGFLAVFDSAGRAVRCAAAMTDSVRPLEIEIRAGLHTGEIAMVGNNARGVAVHAAARIAALAAPGQVCVSSTTRDLLEGSTLAFLDGGRHELKGIDGARQVYVLDR
jgi:class 3 adenylate cyclase